MDFLGIGPTEFLVIALVAFIVLGPARMAEVARNLGKVMREVRRATSELPSLLALDEEPPKPSREDQPKDSEPKALGDTPEERRDDG
jgi:TatA/E family protein of Tat protein translocase